MRKKCDLHMINNDRKEVAWNVFTMFFVAFLVFKSLRSVAVYMENEGALGLILICVLKMNKGFRSLEQHACEELITEFLSELTHLLSFKLCKMFRMDFYFFGIMTCA